MQKQLLKKKRKKENEKKINGILLRRTEKYTGTTVPKQLTEVKYSEHELKKKNLTELFKGNLPS